MITRQHVISKVASLVAAGSVVLGVSNAETLEERVAFLESQLSDKESNGPFGADTARWFEKTSIGGYGELHYNNNLAGDDEIDFHRFVLFINHRFNDRIRLFTELELEHALAGDGKEGEVELEQAFIEMDLQDDLQFRAGLFLLPIGILNEIHEPPTFFGVERNNVEKRIIPTTWWEAGVGVTKKFQSGLVFDGSVTSGLDIDNSPGNIRSGRNKVAEADADSTAVTARLAYNGIEGLRAAVFAQYNSNLSRVENEDGTLFGGTIEYQRGGFGLKALYAEWDIEEGGTIPDGAGDQSGWYIEPSYTWQLSGDTKVGVFARYSDYEYFDGSAKENTDITVGLNYWPVENVVFKADYTVIEDKDDHKDESINLGVGYQF